jgi:5-methylcytosine-specific restriction endonuclease McrA
MATPNDLMYNLLSLTASDAKRQWREEIFLRDGRSCTYCGSSENLTLDHIIPRCRGGSRWDSNNVTTACRSCNQAKGSMSLADFSSMIAV